VDEVRNKMVNGAGGPGSRQVPVTYEEVSYDQIHALADISGYCHQVSDG